MKRGSQSAQKASNPPSLGLGGAALVAVSMFTTIALFGFGVALPPIARAFDGQPHAVLLSQLVGSVPGMAFALSSPIVGRLIDRYSYRPVLIISALIFALSGAAGGLANSLGAILATRILLGCAVAGAQLSGLAGIGDLPEGRKARMLALQAMTGGIMSVMIYPLVGGLAAIGWRWPFLIHLLALVIIPLALTLPVATKSARAGRNGGAPCLGKVPIPILLLAIFVGITGVAGALYSPFFLGQIGIVDPRLQSIPLMGEAIGAIVMGSFYGRLHATLGTNGMFAFALGLCGTGLVAASQSGSLASLTVALALFASGISLSTANISFAVLTEVSQNAGRALGAMTAAMYGAQALFPFVANGISQAAGPPAVFASFGTCALLIASVYIARAGLGSRARQAVLVRPVIPEQL